MFRRKERRSEGDSPQRAPLRGSLQDSCPHPPRDCDVPIESGLAMTTRNGSHHEPDEVGRRDPVILGLLLNKPDRIKEPVSLGRRVTNCLRRRRPALNLAPVKSSLSILFSALMLAGCSSDGQFTLTEKNYAVWRDYITPPENELRWKSIPWRTSFTEGMVDADKFDKPLLLWAMNGHPLGCT